MCVEEGWASLLPFIAAHRSWKPAHPPRHPSTASQSAAKEFGIVEESASEDEDEIREVVGRRQDQAPPQVQSAAAVAAAAEQQQAAAAAAAAGTAASQLQAASVSAASFPPNPPSTCVRQLPPVSHAVCSLTRTTYPPPPFPTKEIP